MVIFQLTFKAATFKGVDYYLTETISNWLTWADLQHFKIKYLVGNTFYLGMNWIMPITKEQ